MADTRELKSRISGTRKDDLKSGDTTQRGDASDQEQPPDAPETPPQQRSLLTKSQLPWLVDDFSGIASSVYEAAMIAAHRARQIGRMQKREVDAWSASLEPTQEGDEEEETSKPGVDHFHHPKPTIKALSELKEEKITFRYPDEEEK